MDTGDRVATFHGGHKELDMIWSLRTTWHIAFLPYDTLKS